MYLMNSTRACVLSPINNLKKDLVPLISICTSLSKLISCAFGRYKLLRFYTFSRDLIFENEFKLSNNLFNVH